MNEQDKIDFIKMKIGQTYSTFGQGSVIRPGTESPLTLAMGSKPMAFALGVDVDSIVRFVLYQNDILEGRIQYDANNVIFSA